MVSQFEIMGHIDQKNRDNNRPPLTSDLDLIQRDSEAEIIEEMCTRYWAIIPLTKAFGAHLSAKND
jgi:hypothetical protein